MLKLKNCSVEKLIDYTEGRRIYAFGAGEFVQFFCKKNKEYKIEEKIFTFIDNDSTKRGTNYIVNNCAIPVMSVDECIKIIEKDDIILISTAFFPDIIDHLDALKELDGFDCFILPYIYDNYYDADLYKKIEAAKEAEQQIPKKIHYCWFGGSEIPNNLIKYMDSWSRFCPDYEITRWDESNYDFRKHEYTLRAYENKKWSRISNYARLDIIYKYGGIYLDTDVELLRPLDSLLFHQAFMGFQSDFKVNTGLGFGGIKNHEMIRILRDDYDNRDFSCDMKNMKLTTCLVYQSEVLQTLGARLDGSFQCINGLALYPDEFFNPFSCHSHSLNITDNSYSIHWQNNSWRDESVRNGICRRQKFYQQNQNRIIDIK